MKIKNKYFSFIKAVLDSFKKTENEDRGLDISKSSARRRFIREITPFISDVEATQDDIRRKYGDKDDKGDMKIVNNMVQFNAKNKKEFEAEWAEFDEQEVDIIVDESNERDIKTIIGLFEDEIKRVHKVTEGKFGAGDFDYFESLSEVVEALKGSYEKITPKKRK